MSGTWTRFERISVWWWKKRVWEHSRKAAESSSLALCRNLIFSPRTQQREKKETWQTDEHSALCEKNTYIDTTAPLRTPRGCTQSISAWYECGQCGTYSGSWLQKHMKDQWQTISSFPRLPCYTTNSHTGRKPSAQRLRNQFVRPQWEEIKPERNTAARRVWLNNWKNLLSFSEIAIIIPFSTYTPLTRRG